MVLKRVLGFLCCCLLLASSVQAAPALLTPWETSGHFTTLAQLETFVHGLGSTGSWKVAVQSAGTSSVRHLPIWAVHLQSGTGSRLKVLILARTHGNEPAVTEACLTLVRDILDDRGDKAAMYRGFDFMVVPCLNPEGAQRAQAEADANDGWWGNAGRDTDSDVDVNRDYLRLSTAEARAAVGLYDSFQPDLVLDLHEYESRPLVAGDGWWRAEYWDLLVGSGRAPWAGASLRKYCRSVVTDGLFPALQTQGVRAEFYMLPTGNFDSSMHFASNAADYFLVRGTPAFLLESAGADQGESSANKRVHFQRAAVDALLQHIGSHRQALAEAVASAARETAATHTVALQVVPHRRAVRLQGTDGVGFGFESHIDIDGRTYHTHQVARFEGLDYEISTTAPLPSAFLIQTRDPDYLRVLTLHGLAMVASARAFSAGAVDYPVGTVVASASPLAGLLLMKEVQDLTPNHLPPRGLVVGAPADFKTPEGKPVVSMEDCVQAIKTSNASGE